jgi:hypothetical protein
MSYYYKINLRTQHSHPFMWCVEIEILTPVYVCVWISGLLRNECVVLGRWLYVWDKSTSSILIAYVPLP